MPLEPGLVAINADRKVILFTAGYLRTDHRAFRAALQPQQKVGVILQTPTRHKAAEIGAQRANRKTSNELQQILRVGADVPQAAARAGARRIGAPGGLLVTAQLQRIHETILLILDPQLAAISDPAVAYHRPRLPHSGIA